MDEAAVAAFLGRTVAFVAPGASSPKRSSVAGLGAQRGDGDDCGAGPGPLDRYLGFGFEIGVADPRHCDIFSQSDTFTAETQ